MSHFERGLYADPDGDLATLWWDLVERFQGVRRPAGDRPHDWATKIHLATAPVYYHNYLLGEVCASQLAATIERETGSPSPAFEPAAAGAMLRERFLRPGRSVAWGPLVEQATGAPLGADAFVRGIVR
jgi:peptidyl-dipeptidase A